MSHLPGAHHVADYLLITAKLEYDMDLNPFKLNKLCYLVNCHTLGERPVPAFYNKIEAWKYGPIVPAVYEIYCIHGEKPIKKLDTCRTKLDDYNKLITRWYDLAKIIGKHATGICNEVLEKYGSYTGNELIHMTTHGHDVWKDIYEAGQNKTISTNVIRKFYIKNQ